MDSIGIGIYSSNQHSSRIDARSDRRNVDDFLDITPVLLHMRVERPACKWMQKKKLGGRKTAAQLDYEPSYPPLNHYTKWSWRQNVHEHGFIPR
jgi:hypothetical protein